MRSFLVLSALGASLLGAGLFLAVATSAPAVAQEAEGETKSDIPADTEIKTTESGLQYSVLSKGPGVGDRPTKADKVTVHYTGWTTDGKKFDSSRDRGEPTSFGLGRVIPGWTEGLQLMQKGDRFKFTIPAGLAYGDRPPPGSGIPKGATLIFDVELIDIMKMPVFKKPGENAKKTEDGLRYEMLVEGTGDSVGEKGIPEFHVAFWNAQGKLLQSTFQQGQPVKAPLGQLNLKVLKTALPLMKAGGRMRCEAPPALGFGDKANGPDLPANSTTYWEIQLLGVTKPLPVPEFKLPTDEELTTTESGLQYQVLEKGDADGKSPRMGQFVTVHYAGWLTDGTPFDSSFSRGETASFQVGRVIKGWNEGLALMKPGDVYKFVIPGKLAYGPNPPPGSVIKADSTLVFYVKLVKLGR